MAYLLDTHVVLWLAYNSRRLTHEIETLLFDKNQTVYFSSVNIWEVAIKSKLGKLDIIGANAKELNSALLENNYLELPVLSKHCLFLEHLPLIHSDPFDRVLIAQAMSENLTLITHDKNILGYPNVKTLNA